MLNVVDVGSVARFLPVIFNQLFHILVATANEDVSLNVVRYVKLWPWEDKLAYCFGMFKRMNAEAYDFSETAEGEGLVRLSPLNLNYWDLFSRAPDGAQQCKINGEILTLTFVCIDQLFLALPI